MLKSCKKCLILKSSKKTICNRTCHAGNKVKVFGYCLIIVSCDTLLKYLVLYLYSHVMMYHYFDLLTPRVRQMPDTMEKQLFPSGSVLTASRVAALLRLITLIVACSDWLFSKYYYSYLQKSPIRYSMTLNPNVTKA